MKTEKENMLHGELYLAGNPEWRRDRMNARRLTRWLNETPETDEKKRTEWIKELFGSTGLNIYIEPTFRCDDGYHLHVGENFYAHFDCVFLDDCKIHIGDHCMLGPWVHIYPGTHPLNAKERISGVEYGKPVTIGYNVWIGGRAVIHPGVKIGNHVVIASGAVVCKDVPDKVVVGGNSARVLKPIEE